MPRFFYPLIILNAILIIGLIVVIFTLTPTSLANRLIFLTLLCSALALTFSFLLYRLASLRKSLFVEPRYLYRKMLRRGLLVAFFITFLL